MIFDNIEELVVIDKRIDTAEEQVTELQHETLRDRWEFGKRVLEKRGTVKKTGAPSKQLPRGAMAELTAATEKGQRELSYRMQFAERYPAEDEVCRAMQTWPTWTQLKQHLDTLIEEEPEAVAPEPIKKKPVKKEPEPHYRPQRRPTSLNEQQRADVIRMVIDEGMSVNLADSIATGDPIRKRGTATRTAGVIQQERARRAALAAEEETTPILWESIPGGYQVKLERAKNAIRKEVEKEVRAQLREEADRFKAQAEAILTEHKAKLNARAERERAERNKERARYDMLSKVHSANGLITPSEYTTILACLHPDNSASNTKRTEAFRIFNDAKVKALLVKEVGK